MTKKELIEKYEEELIVAQKSESYNVRYREYYVAAGWVREQQLIQRFLNDIKQFDSSHHDESVTLPTNEGKYKVCVCQVPNYDSGFRCCNCGGMKNGLQ